LFKADFPGISDPVLVLKAEEPGSKQLLAKQFNKIDNIGFDMINHLINDIVVMGGKPLAVLDVIVVGKLIKEDINKIITAINQACVNQDCSLVGGEISEQPGVLPEGVFVLSSSVVGIVSKKKIIDGSQIKKGDKVIALASNGLHTNGYSLARKICFEMAGLKINDRVDMLDNEIGRELMKVHQSYLKSVGALLNELRPGGMAHITGSGLPGNVIRIIPSGLKAVIDCTTWPKLAIFDYLQKTGQVSDIDMYDAFNMGIGYVIILREYDAEKAEKVLAVNGQKSYRIGRIEKGERAVVLK